MRVASAWRKNMPDGPAPMSATVGADAKVLIPMSGSSSFFPSADGTMPTSSDVALIFLDLCILCGVGGDE